MGVKSTVTLTREEAAVLLMDKMLEGNKRACKLAAETFQGKNFEYLSDREIEDCLEGWNDALNDGHGFENYSIVGNEKCDGRIQ